MAEPLEDDGSFVDDSERKRTEITTRQGNAAACLASGMTKREVCRKCKVGVTALYEWLKQPEFLAEVDRLRREVVDRALGRLTEIMAGKALDKLHQRLDRVDPETGESAATIADIESAFHLFGGLASNVELKAKLDHLLDQLSEGKK